LKKPEQLSFEQGAAIPVNYLTAWALLVTEGGLKKDEAVLIINAGGRRGPGGIGYRQTYRRDDVRHASAGKHEF